MKRVSRAQRREHFLRLAGEMFEEMESWYDAHPEASFGEIEAEARQKRRELMGQALAVLINGRDSGLGVEAPRCSQCGNPMRFHEYRSKTIRGLEGETTLERAYYVCPRGCGETFFPPGPDTETAA